MEPPSITPVDPSLVQPRQPGMTPEPESNPQPGGKQEWL
jgi:hypothetical protein